LPSAPLAAVAQREKALRGSKRIHVVNRFAIQTEWVALARLRYDRGAINDFL
jgi:hypothetical protein